MLPETIRLAEYGLGNNERARQPQAVASRFGPRFYNWQLAQSAEESWRECEIHAQNLVTGTPPVDRPQRAAKGRRRDAQAEAKLAILQEHGDD